MMIQVHPGHLLSRCDILRSGAYRKDRLAFCGEKREDSPRERIGGPSPLEGPPLLTNRPACETAGRLLFARPAKATLMVRQIP
jgi:hypothetical protein